MNAQMQEEALYNLHVYVLGEIQKANVSVLHVCFRRGRASFLCFFAHLVELLPDEERSITLKKALKRKGFLSTAKRTKNTVLLPKKNYGKKHLKNSNDKIK